LRRSLHKRFLCAAIFFAPLMANAASSPLTLREPGLWEIRLVDGSSLAGLALGVQQAVTGLSAEQRKQVERLLGSSAVKLPTVMRYCVTPDMKKVDFKTELAKRNINCSELDYQEAEGSGRFNFVCTSPDGDWTGEGKILDASAKHFRTEAKVQAKYRGQRLAWDMTHEGQWMGADCQGAPELK
jgi:Protein of unknown function (DUF3617).